MISAEPTGEVRPDRAGPAAPQTADRGPVDRDEAFAELVTARRSTRAFGSEVPSAAVMRRIYALAQRAPSWCNVQPWRVHDLSPRETALLASALDAHLQDCEGASDLPMPGEYPEPLLARRRALGYALYAAVGVERSDRDGRAAQARRNFRFFDAPRVAIVTTDARLGEYGTLDTGGYVSTLLLAAASLGVDTVAMAAIATHAPFVRRALNIEGTHAVVCAVAFGTAVPDAPVNALASDRASVDEAVIAGGVCTATPASEPCRERTYGAGGD